MAHVYACSVTISGDESRDDIKVSEGVTPKEASAILNKFQDAGYDGFIETQLVELDEQAIVAQMMSGGWGDWTLGELTRVSPTYDYKQAMVKPVRTFDGKIKWVAMAYMHVARNHDDTTHWALLPEGINHYLENYNVVRSMAEHLSAIANLRADWMHQYETSPLLLPTAANPQI
jgi:hypothetical protein